MLSQHLQTFNASQLVREVLVFVFKLLLVYFLWRCFSLMVGPEAQPLAERPVPAVAAAYEAFSNLLKTNLAEGSAWFIRLFGYEPIVYGNNMVKIQGSSGVEIGNYCLAIELMVLFVALVATYPAPLKLKLPIIIGGVLLIHTVNMLRVAALNLLTVHYPAYADFNHHFTFRILVFLFILFIYERFVKRANQLKIV